MLTAPEHHAVCFTLSAQDARIDHSPSVKPSPLRLWGFLLTVVRRSADRVRLHRELGGDQLHRNSVENAVPTKGIDVWQG
jgi:hypothetical protein